MRKTIRSANVITRRARNELPEMPWIRAAYRIVQCEWIVLPDDDWHALAAGDHGIWSALERKLFIGSYVRQPALIAVVGHPSSPGDPAAEHGRDEVAQIVRRVRSLFLPSRTLGFWADEEGFLEDVVDPDALVGPDWHAELAEALSLAKPRG